MSSICPYDGWCKEKEKRVNDWGKAVRYHAEHNINNVIYTCPDMFDGCPRDRFGNARREECVRYKRYLNIVKKIKANEEQR